MPSNNNRGEPFVLRIQGYDAKTIKRIGYLLTHSLKGFGYPKVLEWDALRFKQGDYKEQDADVIIVLEAKQ